MLDREKRADVPIQAKTTTLQRHRHLGTAGSAVLVLGGVFAGVPPLGDPVMQAPLLRYLRTLTTPSVMCVFVGVSLLLLAWWRVGRLARRDGGITIKELLVTLVWWSAPLLVTAPIFSRDVYSYLAQGMMTALGVDAYQHGPALFGWLAVDVPPIWQNTPAPYGPVFLTLAADVTSITGESKWLGFFGMRLLAIGGLALMVWAVPRIARATGVSPQVAVWLGVLNPLVLIHIVADAHNDALMLGLMMAGLALALERRPAAGAVLVTLAALVKAPAALALVFIVPMWVGQMSGAARWARAAVGTTAVAVGTIVITTIVAGTGYGWIAALDTPTLAHTWTSITTDLGHWTGLLADRFGWASPDQVLAWWRLAGLGAAGVVCLLLLRRYHRKDQVVGLGLGLAAVLALGPVVHPWYLLWSIVPLASAARSQRIQRAVIFMSVTMVVVVLPGGVQPSLDVFLGAALGAALVFGITWVANNVDREAVFDSARAAMRQMRQRDPVPVDTETADDAGGDGRDHRALPERFARVDVGDVHLDQGRGQQGAGVAEGVGVMRPRPRVEHHRRPLVRSHVQPSEHLGLGVGLPHVDGQAEFRSDPHTHLGQFGVRGEAVDIRLPRAESAKIRPVQYVHVHDETSR